jgi:cob(I)alamin adenosyltransferase
MVHLTRIYTRTGDGGTTRLVDNSLVAKTDLRVEAYGTVDELNSAMGVAIAQGALSKSTSDALRIIQNELFDLGCDLATPLNLDATIEPLRIILPSIDRLEGWCDDFMSGLAELNSFVLPGGSAGAAHLHVCRTICRRAERTAWRAADEFGVDTA